jgi:hypothetical protein
LWTTTHILKLLQSFGHVSTNILQEKNISYACSWFGESLQTPNQITTSVMKQRRRRQVPYNKIYNKSTHLKKVDEQRDMP